LAVGRRTLRPEEIAERENDPSELTRRTYRHPWVAGAVGGIAIAAWIRVLGLPLVLAVVVGVALLLWTGYAWRPGGPGQRLRRYILRRFPKKGDT
jgi:hypothetical protein